MSNMNKTTSSVQVQGGDVNTQSELDEILGSSHCDFTPENINEYSYSQICKWCGAIRSNSRHKIKQAIQELIDKKVKEALSERQKSKS